MQNILDQMDATLSGAGHGAMHFVSSVAFATCHAGTRASTTARARSSLSACAVLTVATGCKGAVSRHARDVDVFDDQVGVTACKAASDISAVAFLLSLSSPIDLIPTDGSLTKSIYKKINKTLISS
jgi:hypothetical protein